MLRAHARKHAHTTHALAQLRRIHAVQRRARQARVRIRRAAQPKRPRNRQRRALPVAGDHDDLHAAALQVRDRVRDALPRRVVHRDEAHEHQVRRLVLLRQLGRVAGQGRRWARGLDCVGVAVCHCQYTQPARRRRLRLAGDPGAHFLFKWGRGALRDVVEFAARQECIDAALDVVHFAPDSIDVRTAGVWGVGGDLRSGDGHALCV